MHWHLEALGLPAHADLVAVRRAYAAALRGIDQAADPAGFARLREAYEAARAWCEQAGTADETAPAEVPMPVDEGPADDGAAPEQPEAPPPVDPTVTLAWRFAADVGARRTEAVPQLLEEVLVYLRTQYIDAPGRFEEYLIDLLGLQRIAHRAAVFAAAEEQFHWREVGHLASLGQRGQWIELVLAQREEWLALAEDRRSAWLDLFARAENRLDPSLFRHWPEMAALQERFPGWISLHVSSDTLQAWKAAFDAQSPAAREAFLRMAPPDTAYLPAAAAVARRRARERSTWRVVGGFVLMLFAGLAHVIASHDSQGGSELSFPPLPVSIPADTPRQCMELYARMDKPDAFADMTADEVAMLKARGNRCARRGDWHPPTP